MTPKEQFLTDSREVGKVMRFVGAVFGALLTITAVTHDSHNLFLLLLVLVFWPLLSQTLNLYALFKDKTIGRLIRLLGHRWSPLGYVRDIVACIERWPDGGRCWFLYQIQIFNIAFSVSCVIIYWLFLTFSNVSISWSSTFCGVDRFILFFLDLIALPWFFSDAAQPSMDLMECTRVSRSSQCPIPPNVDCIGLHWWRYVLAAHIIYCLIPRSAFWAYAKYNFDRTHQTAEITYGPQPHPTIWERTKSSLTKAAALIEPPEALKSHLRRWTNKAKLATSHAITKAHSLYKHWRNRSNAP